MDKPEIVFTFPACMGGVASFNYNIINNSILIKQFSSKVILMKAREDLREDFKDKIIADQVITFHYSQKENQFRVMKRLNKLLGNKPGCVVTDNSLSISSARLFNNPKTVFSLIHDDFYVKQSIDMGDMQDVIIAHSPIFNEAVEVESNGLFKRRSYYIPYGVEIPGEIKTKNNKLLNLVFIGRLEESKGVQQLIEIEKILRKRNIEVHWTIIGKGSLRKTLLNQWKECSNISFKEPDSTSEVYSILGDQDIFIFPTVFEGTPVSILEALSCGVITITNDLPGGIRDIVNSEVGFRCEINNLSQFADKIELLDKDRKVLKQMQDNCYHLASAKYDIRKNADNYFRLFMQYQSLKRASKNDMPKLSKLDKPYLPNKLVQLIRTVR